MVVVGVRGSPPPTSSDGASATARAHAKCSAPLRINGVGDRLASCWPNCLVQMYCTRLAAIQRPADTQHVYLPERPEVFAEKFELFSRRMTYPLWTRFGCEIVSDAALADHLKSCGDTACYLIRDAVESAL